MTRRRYRSQCARSLAPRRAVASRRWIAGRSFGAAARWSFAAPGLAGLAAACTKASSSVHRGRQRPSRSLTPDDVAASTGNGWHTLAASLDGRLIRPGEPGYPTARLVYDPLYDDVRPRAVVQAASARDVATTIRFARDHGLPFAARSGGHSYGGYSVSDGIVIDVTAMSSVHADPSPRKRRSAPAQP